VADPQLNDRWSFGSRFEWMRDDDGSRIAGIGALMDSNKGWFAPPGFAGNFYDLTFGLNYRPNGNFLLRPEIRWDWYDGTPNIADQLPYAGSSSKQQFTTAMDLVFTF
jgi:hypothetical protein